MVWFLLLIIPVLLIAGTILSDWWRSGRLLCRQLPRSYRDRESQETAWRQSCQGDALENADALLRTLCEAFGFNPDDRYRFAPTDRIMDVYRACYARWQFWKLGDSMEMESLMTDLNEQFGVEDDKWHPEVTLGEIAGLMKSPARAEHDPEHERP